MAYRIRRKKSVQKSVRKIAGEQIDKAIGEILDEDLDRHETVHQVRKRCKKLRGLIRLVRPVFSEYQAENTFFRDAARELSYVRDAQSIIECFDQLTCHFEEQIVVETFDPIRQQLADRRKQVADDEVGLDKRLDEFLAKMREARQRVGSWKLSDDGFSAVEGGLKKTYARARRGMRKAYEKPGPAAFHEFRKRAKYHWYHARLLRRIWPEMLGIQRDAADTLSDLLGDDHDLAVMRATLLDEPHAFGRGSDVEAFVGLVDRRRVELERKAHPLGQRLLAEKPKRLANRFHEYWTIWRS